MKFIRYFFIGLWALFVWLMVGIIVGIIMLLIFPVHGEGNVVVGISTDWRNLPGTVLGLLAAIQSWRRHTRPNPPKAE